MPDKRALFLTFEKRGPEWVRLNIEGRSWNYETRAAALEWMGKKGIEDQKRVAAAQADQTEIARSSKDAAWVSAEAARLSVQQARRSNLIASLALGAAAIAIAVSVWGLVHH
jgi:hypothetical protein